MKNTKKLPKKQLEKFSNIFTQLGLALVLFIVYITLEHETAQKTVAVFKPDESNVISIEPDTEVFFTKEVKKITKKMVKQNSFIPDEPIEKGDNDVIETIIDEPVEDLVEINENDIVEVNIKEEVENDVDFISIQNAPVFKGCEGLSAKENKVCFDEKMKKFVRRNFNIDLANEIGLQSGKHKIQTQFIINKEGNIIDVKIRAPHKRLEKEAQRIIKKLPKFKPGKQNNRSVKVRYLLPIAFRVE